MITNLWQSFIQLSLGVLILIIVAYAFYVIGLSIVFRRLGEKAWPAFIPAYNYIVLIRILGLPKTWRATVFLPYLGQIYSVAIGVRLGKIFGKDAAFSSIWLTIGAPIGMLLIALSKVEPKLSVTKEPTPHIDAKKIQQTLKQTGKNLKDKI